MGSNRKPGKFRKLGNEELPRLDSALMKHLPKSSQVLNMVRQKILQLIKEPTISDLFLYEDDEETQDFDKWADPFVVCVQNNIHSEYCILLRPPELIPINSGMMQSFEELIDWDRTHIFGSIPQTFLDSYLRQILEKRGIQYKDNPCDAHVLDVDTALNYEKEYTYQDTRNDGISMRVSSIRPIDADIDQILNNYVWTLPHSKGNLSATICNLGSVGVYANPDGDPDFASYAVHSPVGLLQILHTEDAFRRRGLGIIVMKALARKVADLGLLPRAECMVDNDASRQVQLKAGMVFVDKINWILCRQEYDVKKWNKMNSVTIE
ncbi:uncharacterized protein LOC110861276 [Folsomia candida]|uniref:N-acetyltransferase domain-containing protein n=1 Tax=Folsomia candida TaxID=158441 RepID=A0A226D1B5_FOLCA|nr:uncharacterized protein LOC110861276 [Folsomia candida]OXA39382.1 hypothetical protein Fcan01_25874 [Folsomia candida]